MLFKSILGAVALFLALSVQAACPTTPTAYRYRLNGAELTDFQTGLIWARCLVGQTWSGNACLGEPLAMNHEQALSAAQAATGWRLPNAKELFSIVDPGCSGTLAIDPAAFPTARDSTWFWSSTRSGFDDSAMLVSFSGVGAVLSIERSRNVAARLVRINP